jgi:uncharacterized protein YecT (DUF1311 family)
MSQSDLEEPRMVWVGPLPAHMRRADETTAPDEIDTREFADRFEVVPPRPRIGLIVGAALVAGVMIGALVPVAVRWATQPTAATAHPRAAIALATAPQALPSPALEPQPPQAEANETPAAPIEASSPPPAPSVETPRPAHKPVARAPRSALASTGRAQASAEGACRLEGSQADYQVCAFPMVAAADHDLQRAYREARNAGVPAEALSADEAAWQRTRETASHRSATELEIAYRTRIAQVEAMATEAPH